jgi:hypothetical protein
MVESLMSLFSYNTDVSYYTRDINPGHHDANAQTIVFLHDNSVFRKIFFYPCTVMFDYEP